MKSKREDQKSSVCRVDKTAVRKRGKLREPGSSDGFGSIRCAKRGVQMPDRAFVSVSGVERCKKCRYVSYVYTARSGARELKRAEDLSISAGVA